MRTLTILGSTGSIGESTLDVVARHPDRFAVFALVARASIDRVLLQCMRHKPRYVVLTDVAAAGELGRRLRDTGLDTEVLAGNDAAETVAQSREVDTVVAAVVGAAGLKPVLAAAGAGKRILLANKEALVMAGPVFMDAVRRGGATLLPVDSEHNAIFQSLPPGFGRDLPRAGVRRILLTASGGPFRTTPLDRLGDVTPDQACAHPNWAMGRKISVDSATMMNKGLEVIEAHWLFGAAGEQIEVVIHPQSVIHSMVEYADGSVLAQLGNPDMRTPIAQTLAFPERIEAGVAPFDIFSFSQFTFEKPDLARFPCLGLAYGALAAGGTAPATLNAANEIAVEAFLEGRLAFNRIAGTVERVLEKLPAGALTCLDDVLGADAAARSCARELLA